MITLAITLGIIFLCALVRLALECAGEINPAPDQGRIYFEEATRR